MKKAKIQPTTSITRPPIVVILGHVDHGKTTLLDTIRKTHIAEREHGGITQHIGAYQVNVPVKNGIGGKITFIDTPGHEAFAQMRSRGAGVADIAVLVVAADDSVMPQTKESIQQIKSANIPLVVAVNKSDLPTANADKVYKDLARFGIQVEGFGGDVPVIGISAKQGTNIDKLLEMILLLAGMKELAGRPESAFEAVVVETRIDKGKGMLASLVVTKGTLRENESVYEADRQIGKVRAMHDEYGLRMPEAEPGRPVEIMGLTSFPQIGAILTTVPGSKLPDITKPVTELPAAVPDMTPDFLLPLNEARKEHLQIVIKADTAGTLEAITSSLDARINIVSSGLGAITEADILLAKSTKAFVVGFNVKVSGDAVKLAQTEKVIVRTYAVIYELLEELSEVVEGIKEVLAKEREIGSGVITAEFPFDSQRIAGTKVTDGRLARGDFVRLMRDSNEITRLRIKSMRQGKKEINRADTGDECGILFDRKVDFQLNDVIIAVTQV